MVKLKEESDEGEKEKTYLEKIDSRYKPKEDKEVDCDISPRRTFLINYIMRSRTR